MVDPSEAPPPYESATRSKPSTTTAQGHLNVPTGSATNDGIPYSHRRSMEDEARELPIGWVRQYDSKSHHQFFVDTISEPPRSIWHHPYDDEDYLKTVAPHERERIQSLQHPPAGGPHDGDDLSGSDNERHDYGSSYAPLPPRPDASSSSTTKKGLGTKLKDKITHSTHEEREAKRKQRDEEERRYYEQHQRIRAAMARAAQTGEPQLVGRDRDGKEVYVEPPLGPGMGFGGYQGGAYGYNPYDQGPYSSPNARYMSPRQPYGRPYGYGGGYGGRYGGGGMGMGMGGMGLGLGGGLLMGSLLF